MNMKFDKTCKISNLDCLNHKIADARVNFQGINLITRMKLGITMDMWQLESFITRTNENDFEKLSSSSE